MSPPPRPIDRLAGAMLIAAGVVVIGLSALVSAVLIRDAWFGRVAGLLGLLMDRPIDPSVSVRWLGGIAVLTVGLAEAVASIVLGWMSFRGSRAGMLSSIPVVAIRIVVCALIVLVGAVGVIASLSQGADPSWGLITFASGLVATLFLVVNLVLLWIAQRSARA
jgi:hypothetical protein